MLPTKTLHFALPLVLFFRLALISSLAASPSATEFGCAEAVPEHCLHHFNSETDIKQASNHPRQEAARTPDDWHFGKSVQLQNFVPMHVPSDWGEDCAQYAVANVLSALGYTIDAEIYDRLGEILNPKKTGVKIADMCQFLARAFACDVPDAANQADLVAQLDRGLPAVAVVETSSGTLHAVIVSGYTADNYGTIQTWTIADNGVLRGVHSAESFATMWRCASRSHLENFCVLIEPNEKSPEPKEQISDRKDAIDQTRHCVDRELMIQAMAANSSDASAQHLIKLLEDRLRECPFIPQSSAERFLLEEFMNLCDSAPVERTVLDHLEAFFGALDGYAYLIVTPIVLLVIFVVIGLLSRSDD